MNCHIFFLFFFVFHSLFLEKFKKNFERMEKSEYARWKSIIAGPIHLYSTIVTADNLYRTLVVYRVQTVWCCIQYK